MMVHQLAGNLKNADRPYPLKKNKLFEKIDLKKNRNYSVTIVLAVKKNHHYLYGRHFIVRSDHGSLRWLMNFKNPESQLARWLELFGGYNFTIINRAGRIHCNALSRRPCPRSCPHCSRIEASIAVGGVIAQDTEVIAEQMKNSKSPER